ncbi:MAG TPA: amino acid permease [Candidatus Dormibacteraeota bacterium]
MATTTGATDTETAIERADTEQLHQMGYAQELRRKMSVFSNFAISFTIISILSGCLTLYGFGMITGGPVVMSIGWPIVGFFVMIIGLNMAEVASSYPTAGGLYYWSAKLAHTGKRNAPAWSWFTGWFNLLGQVAVTAGIDFGLALFVNAYLNLVFHYPVGPRWLILIYGIVLVLHGLLNTFGIALVALLNDISVWWHVFGVLIIVGTLVIVPSQHQSFSFVFTERVNGTGFSSMIYVVLIGLLLSQYTLTGYDASAHMSEETKEANRSAPWGIVTSIGVSVIFGWILLLGVTFAIQDYAGESASATGVPPAQIFIDAAGYRTGLLLLLIAIGAQFFCGMSSITSNSRMIYAFSRDGALPASSLWHRINKRTRTPTNSIWLAAAGAFILGLPYLWNPSAYAAVTSIAVIGLYIAYVMPIFLRLVVGDRFVKGPWHLGSWGRPLAVVSVAWVAFITVLFCLPQTGPFDQISLYNFNYAVIAAAGVLLFSGGWWFLGARRWFKGPRVQGTPEELRAIERALEVG